MWRNNPISAEAGYNQDPPLCPSTPTSSTGWWQAASMTMPSRLQRSRAAGKQDVTAAIFVRRYPLINNWDAGITDGCWKAALYVPQLNPSASARVVLHLPMMVGWWTPETAYPEWVNEAGGETYATVSTIEKIISVDNYKDYMAAVDEHCGTDWYPYDYNGVEYNFVPEPPASYKNA